MDNPKNGGRVEMDNPKIHTPPQGFFGILPYCSFTYTSRSRSSPPYVCELESTAHYGNKEGVTRTLTKLKKNVSNDAIL